MTQAYPSRAVFVCREASRAAEADTLAERLGIERATHVPTDSGCLVLQLDSRRLTLQSSGPNAPGPVFAEFTSGPVGWRGRHALPRDEALARAAGVRATHPPTVIDATAGLGRDAFILAALGCEVILIERNPVVAALIEDGLCRAIADERTRPVVQRMRLLTQDAQEALKSMRADVVLVDPMHPPRRKRAAVRKEMRLLQQLVGADADAPQLLEAALAAASRRVVAKRPRGTAPIAGPPPSGSVEGRSTRFDIYAGANR